MHNMEVIDSNTAEPPEVRFYKQVTPSGSQVFSYVPFQAFDSKICISSPMSLPHPHVMLDDGSMMIDPTGDVQHEMPTHGFGMADSLLQSPPASAPGDVFWHYPITFPSTSISPQNVFRSPPHMLSPYRLMSSLSPRDGCCDPQSLFVNPSATATEMYTSPHSVAHSPKPEMVVVKPVPPKAPLAPETPSKQRLPSTWNINLDRGLVRIAKAPTKDGSLESIPAPVSRQWTTTRNARLSATIIPSDPAKLFVCDVLGCGKRFRRSENLKRHARSRHTLEKPYTCHQPGCTIRFSWSDNLKQHLRVHKRDKATPRNLGQ
jgi:Zinc finger, C2H2 type